MSLAQLSVFRIKDRLRHFPLSYERVPTDLERSTDSESEADPSLPLKRESIASNNDKVAYEAIWNRDNDHANGCKPWLLIVMALLFLISLSVDLFMRSRIDGACTSLMEPWSKIYICARN